MALSVLAPFVLWISVLGAPGVSDPADTIVYATSFENYEDLAGWIRAPLMLSGAAPGGGQHAALVAGGCPRPHSWYQFVAPDSGKLVLRLWGKSLLAEGDITLTNRSLGTHLRVSISAPDWAPYSAGDVLEVHRGDTLSIMMNAGGLLPAKILVDLLEVRHAS